MSRTQDRFNSLGQKIIFANRAEIESCYLDYLRRMNESTEYKGFKRTNTLAARSHDDNDRTGHKGYDALVASARAQGKKTISFGEVRETLMYAS